jgi:hypothetical protein
VVSRVGPSTVVGWPWDEEGRVRAYSGMRTEQVGE